MTAEKIVDFFSKYSKDEQIMIWFMDCKDCEQYMDLDKQNWPLLGERYTNKIEEWLYETMYDVISDEVTDIQFKQQVNQD